MPKRLRRERSTKESVTGSEPSTKIRRRIASSCASMLGERPDALLQTWMQLITASDTHMVCSVDYNLRTIQVANMPEMLFWDSLAVVNVSPMHLSIDLRRFLGNYLTTNFFLACLTGQITNRQGHVVALVDAIHLPANASSLDNVVEGWMKKGLYATVYPKHGTATDDVRCILPCPSKNKARLLELLRANPDCLIECDIGSTDVSFLISQMKCQWRNVKAAILDLGDMGYELPDVFEYDGPVEDWITFPVVQNIIKQACLQDDDNKNRMRDYFCLLQHWLKMKEDGN